MNSTADIIKILKSLRGRHDMYTVFRDTIEVLAITISNGCDKPQFDGREARYLEIVKDYSREELDLMAQFLALLVEAMEWGADDYLGKLFMELELSSDSAGQFFTPYSLCRLMAMMQIDASTVQTALGEKGYIAMHEPAVGAGGMVLAAEEALRALGHHGVMHVTCVDTDIKAVHMAYLQLSLAGIPAIVIHGNTLSLEQWSIWYTPAHIFGGWWWRLQRGKKAAAAAELAPTVDVVMPIARTLGQLNLFEATA